MTKIEVRHDPERQRFSAFVDDQESYLDYGIVDENTVEYRRTYTPPELRGRGIASEVVKVALEWADARGKRVVPSCWFVQVHLDRKANT
jgi:predicted GNAT family acetyltransferase